MPTITLLRGFKVPVAVLDAFLRANNLDDTHGMSLLPDQDQEISALLAGKMDTGKARVIIPQREGFSLSHLAYVAFSWLHVFAQREVELEEDLPEIPPPAFLRLKNEILSFGAAEGRDDEDSRVGAIGFYVVFTNDRMWIPQVLSDRVQPPIHCDRCDAVFDDFAQRQHHRRDEHGSLEDINPLPEA